LGFDKSFGNSSGFHAPGEYPFVPYVWANVMDESANTIARTASKPMKRFRILQFPP
jgi:hypothetical protein